MVRDWRREGGWDEGYGFVAEWLRGCFHSRMRDALQDERGDVVL